MNPQNSPTPSTPAEGTGFGGGVTESGGAFSDTKNKVAQAARDTATKVKSAAATTTAKVKDRAEHVATEKKEAAASRIGSYSSAIHESARSLEDNDPNIAWFTHRAADKLQSVADYMRNSDWTALRGGCENFARQHPMAFFGGLFLTGLVLGNVVKASQGKLQENGHGEDQMGFGGQSNWAEPSGELQRNEGGLPAPSTTSDI